LRRANRRDQNEKGIVDALRAVGALVFRLDLPCDLLVFHRGKWHCLEIKTEKGKTETKQESQREFLLLTGTPVVRTPEAALRAIGL
jgi:hypothetical protein